MVNAVLNGVYSPHALPATSLDPLSRHKMPDVRKGIEKQKEADQKKIAEKTGKKC